MKIWRRSREARVAFEQAVAIARQTERADIWAFGCVLYELLIRMQPAVLPPAASGMIR